MSSRFVLRSVQVALDLFVLCVAYGLAFLFRFEFQLTGQWLKLLFFTLPYVVLFQYVVLVFAGVPAMSWRYVGLRETKRIVLGLIVATTVLVGFRIGFAEWGGHARFLRIPLGVLAMNFIMAFLGVAGVRVLRRVLAEWSDRNKVTVARKSKRTLLLGAGSAGSLVAKEIGGRPDLGIELVGFADDDPVKLGLVIQGKRVLGTTHEISSLIEKHDIEQVIITMSSVSSSVIRRVVESCDKAGRPAKIIPGLYEILGGRVNLSRIREVTIDDLLGRDAVQLDVDLLHSFLSGKRVLVTGAGGSIGSELCRQLASLDPSRLLLVDHSEIGLFNIHSELTRTREELDVVPCICDVRDEDRVDTIFERYKPEVVFHAAAHKHVPLMEWNPGEAIKTNVFGTCQVADAADRHGVGDFVLVSTDKAVNPTSIMGASKRAAELYVQSMSQSSKTKFVAVRFGNVLGSTGSVIPTFKAQIRRGGPVTVTHPEMQRYFMTIPEASQLVLQAGAMGNGGEIFVLDMGEPVKIVQLARDLIRLSGLTEAEVPIEFTGVRPGEKLFEELSIDSENIAKTRHPKIYIGKIDAQAREHVLRHFEQLREVTNRCSREKVRFALGALIPELRDSDENAPLETPSPAPPVGQVETADASPPLRVRYANK